MKSEEVKLPHSQSASVTQSMAPKIRVDLTPNKGRGVFALCEIKVGESIEEAPVVTIPENQVAQVDATALGDYCFLWGENLNELALLLGLCSVCNHSYQPNAEFVLHLDRQTIEFVALRDIGIGEEVTTNYNGDPESQKPVWFIPGI